MQRPPADARKKNDTNDSIFLARLLSTHNIVEVFVPDEETEAARDLVRAQSDCRADLTRARQRLNLFLVRHGFVFNERNASGAPVGCWTKTHWAWIREIDFKDEADQDVFAYYIAEVRRLESTKKQLENWIGRHAKLDRWRMRVDALRCLKGIETVTAFALVVEAGVFSRFKSARAFSAWTGLVPSEYSSGERKANGGISKTGNSLVRRALIESAWHYTRASQGRKSAPSPEVPLAIENHAAKATKRLVKRRKDMARMKPCIANCATARELACWIWAIGCMAEGTM